MAACCSNDLPPVVNNYKGRGESLTLKTESGEEFPAYHVGSGERGVLHVPDIWGTHPNHHQVADILAGQALPADPSVFPPPGGWPEVMAYLGKFPYAEKVRPVLIAGLAELKKRGANKIGGLGLCWGGGQLFKLSAEGLIHVVASAHPSTQLNVPDAEKLTGPVCFLPAGDDPEWKEMEQHVRYIKHDSKFAKQNVYERFPDMHHGWLGARGRNLTDYTLAAQSQGATRALRIITEFFRANL